MIKRSRMAKDSLTPLEELLSGKDCEEKKAFLAREKNAWMCFTCLEEKCCCE